MYHQPRAGEPSTSTHYPAAAYTTPYTPNVATHYGGIPPGATPVPYLPFNSSTINPGSALPVSPGRGVGSGSAGPPPGDPDVTPQIAAGAIRKLVGVELKRAGFEKGDPTAVKKLEYEVQAFVQQLYQRAQEYANLASRAGAMASDVQRACDEFDMPIEDLRAVARQSRKRKRRIPITPSQLSSALIIPEPRSRSPSPELLASDDSDDEGMGDSTGVGAGIGGMGAGVGGVNGEHGGRTKKTLPATLRSLPTYLPSLPPKHTYMKTPASPPKKAALPSLEKKLKTAGLVQKSLQNLLTATEDNTNNEDAELLGHIVNWETGLHMRKRWKVGPR